MPVKRTEMSSEMSTEMFSDPVLMRPSTAGETTPHPSDFFLAALSGLEQQQFLDFCVGRQLDPEAGILAFLKEKLQRGELDSVRGNPFTDEAQAAIDAVRQESGARASYQIGKKVTKPCEICGDPVTVDRPGRLLCDKSSCWHAYAGLTLKEVPDVRAGAGMERRLGKLESLVERVVEKLNQVFGGEGANRAA